MADVLEHVHDIPVYVCGPDGPVLDTEDAVLDMIIAAGRYGAGADWVVVAHERLSAEFFTLSTKFAGMVTQKFTMYGLGFAVLGDFSARASGPVDDWVRESNKGRHVWFVKDMDHFAELLAKVAARRVK